MNIAVGSCSFNFPCVDHQPTHARDEETGWMTIECLNCHMRMHIHPQTYEDLIISIEIDEIEEQFLRRK